MLLMNVTDIKEAQYYRERYHTDDRYYLKKLLDRMIYRCQNENDKYYGARGISVCQEWLDDSDSFVNWALNNGWRRGLVIDRIDNHLGYTPDNCRFVTVTESNQNREMWTTDPQAMTRKCKSCGKVKPLTEFHKDKTRPMGRTYRCRECRNREAREKYTRVHHPIPEQMSR